MKSSSTVRDTRRGTQSYMEKRRGSREIEVTRRRRGGSKGREQASQYSLPYVLSTVWTPQRCSQSYTEKRSGRKETEVARRIKGDSKGERQIQPVISSLSVLHSPEHTKRFTKLGTEEKGERGDRGNLVEKKESQKGERAIKPVITLPSDNGY